MPLAPAADALCLLLKSLVTPDVAVKNQIREWGGAEGRRRESQEDVGQAPRDLGSPSSLAI